MIRRSRSPVDQIQDELRKAFLSGTTPSIQGSTGSGKSTRVVEFLLTVLEQFEQSESCFIAVTCPGRITAVALTKEAGERSCSATRPARHCRLLVQGTNDLLNPAGAQVGFLC